MRDTIKQAFQDMIGRCVEAVFTNPKQFKGAISDVLGNRGVAGGEAKRIRNLLNIAVIDMDAYSRLKTAIAKNEFYVVGNLVSEMESDYGVKREYAEVVMDCIAELLTNKQLNVAIGSNMSAKECFEKGIDFYDAKAVEWYRKAAEQGDATAAKKLERLKINPNVVKSTTPQSLFQAKTQPNAIVGSNMTFGGYDWRVLDIQGSQVLLLSELVLEERAYHKKDIKITWENCTLHHYLNKEFYNSLPANDRSRIIAKTNVNHKNPWFGTDGGRDTKDKVFLLSLDEVVNYLGDSGMFKKGINPSERNNNLKWRTRGISEIKDIEQISCFLWLQLKKRHSLP